jgi:peptidoglycan/LPS O-acetylase OafA/YrhL
MCMLLSKHEKLGLEQISNFYFRRIKRIVAIYLFTIFVFQLSAILWWLSPLDYNTFYIKSIGPIFFVSNLNNPSNYFDLTSSFYKFYLHLWSLAVEIQFYLIVPFLMLVLSFVHINVRILTVALIASISFWIQFNLTGNKEHMSLHGRIWQFMFGFIAFYINQIKEKSGKGTRCVNFERFKIDIILHMFR